MAKLKKADVYSIQKGHVVGKKAVERIRKKRKTESQLRQSMASLQPVIIQHNSQSTAPSQEPWTPFVDVTDELFVLSEKLADVASAVSACVFGTGPRKAYRNSRYMVFVEQGEISGGEWNYLSIRANDRSACHDWRDFQRIKNELCGPEREAVELYPAESRLMDTANQFWLFVLPAGLKMPFGFERRVVIEEEGEGTGQRRFDDDNRPADVMTEDEAIAIAKQGSTPQ